MFVRLIFIFIFLWGIPLSGSNILYYFSNFILLLCLPLIPYKNIYPKNIILLFIPFIIYTFILSISRLESFTGIYLIRAFILLLSYISFSYLYFLLFKADSKLFIKDNLVISGFNSIVMILQAFLPGIRMFFINLTDPKAAGYEYLYQIYRFSGFAFGGVGSVFTIFILLLSVFSFILNLPKKYKFLSLFNLMMSIFTGRLGIAIGLAILLLYLLFAFVKFLPTLKTNLNNLILITSTFTSVILLIIAINFVSFNDYGNGVIVHNISRIQGEISVNEKLREEARIRTRTRDSTSTFLRLINGIKVIGNYPDSYLFFGSGDKISNANESYMRSETYNSVTLDSAFTRYIYSFGIIYTTFFCIVYFSTLFLGYRKYGAFNASLIVIILLISSFKEDMFFARYIFPMIVVLNLLDHLNRKRLNNKYH